MKILAAHFQSIGVADLATLCAADNVKYCKGERVDFIKKQQLQVVSMLKDNLNECHLSLKIFSEKMRGYSCEMGTQKCIIMTKIVD